MLTNLLILASETEHGGPAIAHLVEAAGQAWLIPFFPLLAFLIIVLFTRSSGPVSAGVSILGIFSSLVVAFRVFSQRLQEHMGMPTMEESYPWISVSENLLGTLHIGVLIDNLSATMLLMVCFIALLIQIYSYGYIGKEIGHFPTQDTATMSRFYAYLSLFAFSMLGLVVSNNLLQIYIFWELVGVCSYFLIGFWYFKKSAADACKKAFIVTKFADLGFLAGILIVGIGSGTFNFLKLAEPGVAQAGTFGVSLGLILIFCGAIGKSAQFPLQVWLPDAMEGPTPVSALIHAATMVAAGIYMVARMFSLFWAHPAAAIFVACIGTLTALVAASIALVQNDIKRVLAYSTVSQLGFMLAALGCGAFTAGVFHLITHAFFKALLFLGSGAVIVACHSNDMWKMGGLRKYLGFTHFAFACGCLALAGIPPFAGFWSKDEIMAGVSHYPPIQIGLTLAAFMTAFYVTRMYCMTFLGEYRGDDKAGPYAGPVPPESYLAPLQPTREVIEVSPEWTEEMAAASQEELPPACLGAHMEHAPHHDGPPHEVSPVMYGPLLILSVFAVGLGFAGMPKEVAGDNLFHHLIQSSAAPHHEFSWTPMIVSTLVAFAGVLLGFKLYARDPEVGDRKMRKLLGPIWTFLEQKWYMDHFWAWMVSYTMFGLARLSAWIDDNIVDGAIRGSAQLTTYLGDRLRAEHTGLVQHYLMLLIGALIILVMIVASLEPEFALNPTRLFMMGIGR